MKLGEKIKAMRKARGWSYQQLADMTNISKQHVWSLEKGTILSPRIDIFVALAKAFAISVDDLISDEEPPKCLVSELKKRADVTYLTCDESVASDISEYLTLAASRIEQLEALIRHTISNAYAEKRRR